MRNLILPLLNCLVLFLPESSFAAELSFRKPFGFAPYYQEGSAESKFVSKDNLHVVFPANTFGPHESGYNFSALISPTDVRTLSYEVRFSKDFDFVKGGKLPGLCGGKDATGGLSPADGFSTRVMWRKEGRLVSYVYHLNQAGKYGDDFQWANNGQPIFITRDKWHSVKFLVKLNDAPKSNGLLQVTYDGAVVFKKSDFLFRRESSTKIDRFCFNAFYGGSDQTWAPLKKQELWIRNVSIDD